MKILVFVKTFANPTLTFIYNEITELSKHAEVLVVTCERKNEDLFPFTNVIEIPFFEDTLLSKIQKKFQFADFEFAFKNATFSKKLNNVIAEFNPDIVHTHFGFESWFFLENILLQNTPIFISFHGFDASHKLNSSRYRETLKTIFAKPNITPIFVSNFMLNNVETKLGISIAKAKTLYYGTDIKIFRRDNYEENDRIIFLQVSSFVEKKGHKYTIEAFADFLKQKPPILKVKLILAGTGPLHQTMKQLTHDLGIEQYVEFPSVVDRFQAKELMNKANVFIHHSVTSLAEGDMEGIPNAIMEAMAMELPILSTVHSGIPELVEDGVNGLLAHERDVEIYAKNMLKIVSWKPMAINRTKIESLFEKEKHAYVLLKYYQEAITKV